MNLQDARKMFQHPVILSWVTEYAQQGWSMDETARLMGFSLVMFEWLMADSSALRAAWQKGLRREAG